MITTHRFELNNSINDIDIPKGAVILSAGIVPNAEGKESISIWAMVDTDASKSKHRFLVFGTGANMDDTINFNLNFIGTVTKSNKYAFHIFEVKDRL